MSITDDPIERSSSIRAHLDCPSFKLQIFFDSVSYYLIVFYQENSYCLYYFQCLCRRTAGWFTTVDTPAPPLPDWFSELSNLFVPRDLCRKVLVTQVEHVRCIRNRAFRVLERQCYQVLLISLNLFVEGKVRPIERGGNLGRRMNYR